MLQQILFQIFLLNANLLKAELQHPILRKFFPLRFPSNNAGWLNYYENGRHCLKRLGYMGRVNGNIDSGTYFIGGPLAWDSHNFWNNVL